MLRNKHSVVQHQILTFTQWGRGLQRVNLGETIFVFSTMFWHIPSNTSWTRTGGRYFCSNSSRNSLIHLNCRRRTVMGSRCLFKCGRATRMLLLHVTFQTSRELFNNRLDQAWVPIAVRLSVFKDIRYCPEMDRWGDALYYGADNWQMSTAS